MPNSSTGARRPILNRNMVDSLAKLVATTPATAETESALRYLQKLVQYERRPETEARRREQSQNVQAIKRRANPIIGTRKRGGNRLKRTEWERLGGDENPALYRIQTTGGNWRYYRKGN